MRLRALSLALAISFAPIAANAGGDEDPFASETPMDNETLAQARGGLVVNGFLIDFALQTTLIIDGIGSLPGIGGPIAFDIDPSINTLIINNSLDGVQISHVVALDVAIPNFDAALASAVAAGAGPDISATLFSLSGF